MSFKIQVTSWKMESNARKGKIFKKLNKNLNKTSIILKVFISVTLAIKFSIMSYPKKKWFNKILKHSTIK